MVIENFKFILLSIIVLAVVGILGYWAVRTIEPGDIHVSRQKQEELETKNAELEKEVAELTSELETLKSEQEKESLNVPAEKPEEKPAPTPAPTYKYQSLINDLQKLVDQKIAIKEKSTGTRVGTVQTFLNLYNKTSKKVDNEFGPGMKTDVINFQKAVGVIADGEAGPSTFRKMIEWLKKQ